LSEFKRQVSRFIIIGGFATTVHICTALTLNEGVGVLPFWANLAAFLFSWLISYFGNFFWTFETNSTHQWSMPRFGFTSITGLVLNQLIVWTATEVMGLSLRWALVPVVLVVPTVSFVMSRYWAFLSRTTATIE